MCISRIEGFMIDLDGTTYLGDRIIPGAAEFYKAAKAIGKKVLYLTNNSSSGPAQYAEKLRSIGIPVAEREVFTSGEATISYLKTAGCRCIFPVTTACFRTMILKAGFDVADGMRTRSGKAPECVVLGYDSELTYQKLKTACLLLRAGARFVVSHPDPVFPAAEGSLPDAGSMLAMIESATGRQPEVIVGKPNRLMLELALKRLGVAAGKAAMIGDRLSTDIMMAVNGGVASVLVLTGESTRAQAESFPHRIDCIFESIADLVPLLAGQDERRRR